MKEVLERERASMERTGPPSGDSTKTHKRGKPREQSIALRSIASAIVFWSFRNRSGPLLEIMTSSPFFLPPPTGSASRVPVPDSPLIDPPEEPQPPTLVAKRLQTARSTHDGELSAGSQAGQGLARQAPAAGSGLLRPARPVVASLRPVAPLSTGTRAQGDSRSTRRHAGLSASPVGSSGGLGREE